MMHEESGIGLDPTFSVKAEATAGDHQMDVGMPFHVGAKRVDDNKYAHTHFQPYNAAGPIVGNHPRIFAGPACN